MFDTHTHTHVPVRGNMYHCVCVLVVASFFAVLQFMEEVVEVQDEQEFLKQQQSRLGRASDLVDGGSRRECVP